MSAIRIDPAPPTPTPDPIPVPPNPMPDPGDPVPRPEPEPPDPDEPVSMIDAPISRVRMRDLARPGGYRQG